MSHFESQMSHPAVLATLLRKQKKQKEALKLHWYYFLTREEWEEITGDSDQGLVSGLLSLKIFLCVDFHCSHGGKTETNSSSSQHFHSALPPSVQRVLKLQS
jgi:hypothetical protein